MIYSNQEMREKKLKQLKEDYAYGELYGAAAVELDNLIAETAKAKKATQDLKDSMLETYTGINKL